MQAKRQHKWKRLALGIPAALLAFILLAYVILPMTWRHFRHEPALAGLDMRTRTADGIAGDPINVGFAASEAELLSAFSQIGWTRADPANLKSGAEIAETVILGRPYASAPVSALYYLGRKQDLAFEKQAGASADQRHHVRLWLAVSQGAHGRPLWLGAATFDKGVGLSRYTGQITHHIDADIDAERDRLTAEVSAAGLADMVYQVSGAGPALAGRNGEGDLFHTDGKATISVLRPGAKASPEPPRLLASPP